jgi:hypothetical protein
VTERPGRIIAAQFHFLGADQPIDIAAFVIDHIDQRDMGQEATNLIGIDIAAGRHRSPGAFLLPVLQHQPDIRMTCFNPILHALASSDTNDTADNEWRKHVVCGEAGQ